MSFYLITYVEHKGHKHNEMAELVEGTEGKFLKDQLIELNRRKLLQTTDYRFYNLTKILEEKQMSISREVVGEVAEPKEDKEEIKEDKTETSVASVVDPTPSEKRAKLEEEENAT